MSESGEEQASLFTDFHRKEIDEALSHLNRCLDGYVLVALVSDNDLKRDGTRAYWKGGRVQAIGLCRIFEQGEFWS